MKITDLSGKTVCILGYGREGKAMVSALEKYAPDCEITIADSDSTIEPENGKHWLQVGEGWLKNLEKFDVIIKSPGIPPNLLTSLPPYLLTSSTQIFLDTIADRGAVTIGVTGSKGKSTTASLIYAILNTQYPIPNTRNVILTGNIGEPSIAHLDDIKKGTIVVMEMSSYQLMNLTTSPHIAVITSFFPEHLDYHGSLRAYREAKANICRFQEPDDLVFFQADTAASLAKEGLGRKIPFSADECPVDLSETQLIGDHNASNIAAACMVATVLGIDGSTVIKTLKNFRGLPHRLQSLGIHHGMEWIDDAISTTPESTIAALDALGDDVQTIILGGQDRGNDFSKLAKRIKKSSIQTILLFPGSGPRIREALVEAKVEIELIDVDSMEKVVALAKSKTIPNTQYPILNTSIVLLSTASPSYGMFKNFEEKGEKFKQCVIA